MSEKIIRLLFKELGIVRIICRNCRTVVEMETQDLDKIKVNLLCPGCQTKLRLWEYGNLDKLSELSRAYKALTDGDGPIDVEFIIPEKS